MSAASREALIDWQRELDRDPDYAAWSDMIDKTATQQKKDGNDNESHNTQRKHEK